MSYQPKPLPERKQKLEMEIVRVSQVHPTLGYKKITRKLVELGYCVNKKQVQRIRREERLQVPPPKPRQRRRGVSTGLPQQAGHKNHVWAWDFVSDYTERGGRLRTFNLIDVYTRECHCIHADRTINYNHERPHRSLGLQTPAAFAKNQGVQGSGSSRATPSLHRNLDETDKPKPPETIS